MNKKDKARDYRLKRIYGISLAQYEEILQKQDECCALCRRHQSEFNKNLAVDHDHNSLEIRGLLCTYCNQRLIGRHRDGNLLRRMADYVDQGTGLFAPKPKPKRKRKRKKKK